MSGGESIISKERNKQQKESGGNSRELIGRERAQVRVEKRRRIAVPGGGYADRRCGTRKKMKKRSEAR